MKGSSGLIGLLAAETVSKIGSRMSMVALPWFVLVLTGSPAKAGVMAFAEMLPYVLGCALGGPLLDRLGVRRASVAADAVSAVVVAGVPLLHRAGHLGFGALLAVVAVAGLLRALGDTAKQSIFGRVAPEAGMDLTRATGLHDGLSRLSGMLGAPLAGGLIALLGAPTVLLLDAATFAFGALAVLATVPGWRRPAVPDPGDLPTGVEPAGAVGGAPESYLGSLRTGWRFLRRERLVLGISVMLVLTNLFDQAYSAVLAPVWARDVAGSAAALGILFGLTGLGAVLGNVVFVAVAPRVPRWTVFAFGFLLGGSPRMFAAAFASHAWVVYLVTFCGGIALAGLNPILGAVLYERVPDALRTRVLGMSQAMSWAGIPLGGLLGGALVEWGGLRLSLLAFAFAYLATTLLPFLDRTWRKLDDRPTATDTVEPARATAAATA